MADSQEKPLYKGENLNLPQPQQCVEDGRINFTEFIKKYVAYMRNIIARILRDDPDSIDDVLQNIWIQIYRNFESFKGESNLKTWLYRIAKNEALMFLRRGARRRMRDALNHQDELNLIADNKTPSSYSLVALKEQADRFGEFVDTLDPTYRKPFTLYLQGFSAQEIADQLNLSVGAVKTRIHRVNVWIRAQMKSEIPLSITLRPLSPPLKAAA